MKRLLTLVSVICMMLSVSVFAEEMFSSGEWEYYINDDGTVTISNWNGESDSVIIPEVIDDKQVTAIGKCAFNARRGLVSIKIPDMVTEIGDRAFSYCSGLTSIEIPDSVTSIGSAAFRGCSSLTSIKIPDSVTDVGYGAFGACNGLTSIEIPDSVIKVRGNAFESCMSLTNLIVSPENEKYAVIDNVLFEKSTKTLICYPCGLANNSYIIPEGILRIGDGAFCGCDKLTSIEIPNSVTEIEDGAFAYCDSLTSIEIPDSVTEIGNEAFHSCDSLTSIEIPDSVTEIGEYAFNGCESLASIRIPDMVTEIGEGAFSYCSSLTSIEIPDTVTSIGSNAFRNCFRLPSITIPNSVTEIGPYAFSECMQLTSIEIPDSVIAIGRGVFSNCRDLVNIIVSPENKNYAVIDNVLIEKSTKTLICYPAGLTDSSYTIPEGVITIGESAFDSYYNSLIEIKIPDSVVLIEESSFMSCSELEHVEISNSVTKIGNYAFFGCSCLTGVVIPDSVTEIGNQAFYACSSLTSVVVPDSVTEIGSNAFSGCESLTMIVEHGSFAAQYASEHGITYTYPDANDWLNVSSENTDSDQRHFDTTFTSSSGNIGNATVSLKSGFDFINTDSSIFNYELALTAVTLSAQVYKSAQGRSTEEILSELGYDDTDFSNVDSSFGHPGVCFGYKHLEDGKNIFVAVVRGTDTTDDLIDVWTDIQDGALSMFRVSGDYVELQLEDFMESATGKTKAELLQEDNYFFFTGHSLGGAIANYLSVNKDVMEFVDSNKGKIYTYTFEPPHTCVHLLGTDPESESNALNYKVDGDAVTNMPPYPGSTTYGKDEWIRVSELDDDLFNSLFPDSKCKTLAIATSRDGHGDIFGLHDTFLGLVYIVQQNDNISSGDGGGGGSGR